MPANALPPPMPRAVFEDCTLDNRCHFHVDESIAEASTSVFNDQLSFINDEFFAEQHKDFTYEFFIDHFPNCTETYLESEPFDGGSGGELKWRLRVYPRLLCDDLNEYVGIFLRLDENHHKNILASFSFSWINDDDDVIEFVQTPHAYLFYKGKDLGYEKFVKRDDVIATMLQFREQEEDVYFTEYDGSLRILCEVKIKSSSDSMDLETMGRHVYKKNDRLFPQKKLSLYIV
uniref:BTB and MATH domain-containing protein 43 n=1 Tax=Ascaris suum TaxID=6253 RepID=F1LC30_ASCSU